jgi:hypothetical protein
MNYKPIMAVYTRLTRIAHHHFTKAQLLSEEVIIIIILSAMVAITTLAAEVLLPIRVNLVRCVTQDERARMCEERNLCCHLVERRPQPDVKEDDQDIEGINTSTVLE